MNLAARHVDYARGFVCLHKKTDYSMELYKHSHKGCEIIYIVSGKGKIFLDDEHVEISDSLLCIIPSGVIHGVEIEAESIYERYTLNVDDGFLQLFRRVFSSEYLDDILFAGKSLAVKLIPFDAKVRECESELVNSIFSLLANQRSMPEECKQYLFMLVLGALVEEKNGCGSLWYIFRVSVSSFFASLYCK